jgi:hypothetical protein
MTPRTIRRAAERKANKLARKIAAQQGISQPDFLSAMEEPLADLTTETPATTPSPATTPAPAIPPATESNANLTAVTSELTGETTLLPTTDAAPYTQLLHAYAAELQPIGHQESTLVQTLAETTWRAQRCFALDMAIFAKGRIEFALQFAEHKPELRDSLIDVHTFLTYEKQIRCLQLQEARLTRRADKARAELRTLQQERNQREEHARRKQHEDRQRQLEAAAQLYQTACKNQQIFQPEQNGFEFSNQEIESYLAAKQIAQDRFAAALNIPMRAKAA